MSTTVTVRLLDDQGQQTGPLQVEKVVMPDTAWQRVLTDEQYRIMRTRGTERPFCGVFHDHAGEGIYACAGCGLPLFEADTKFDSGTGWPSFAAPWAAENVTERRDTGHGMVRMEVLCARCDAHLGHVFDDGPAPGGRRYCMNSASMELHSWQAVRGQDAEGRLLAKATFAAGCFWGIEEAFRTTEGVVRTRVGYTGGTVPYPTYKQTCTGQTGHAEAVQVLYDPEKVSYAALLELFWGLHNPTTLNRQGPDIGSQYRSAVFYHTPEQKDEAERSKKALDRTGVFRGPVVTEIRHAGPFYAAEPYHQGYAQKHGACAAP